MSLAAKVKRVWSSAVFWNWVFNGLRLGAAILLLPILLRKLTQADLGMHYTWLYLVNLFLLLDSTVALGIGRNVAYAMRGVKKLQPLGISDLPGDGCPNYELLGRLLHATRHCYLGISIFLLLFLALVGTGIVSLTIHETRNPQISWMGWILLCLAAPLEVYTGAHLVFLRGMNLMLLTARLSAVVYGFKLMFSCGLLLADYGLLAVPISSLASALLQRILAVYYAKKMIPPEARAFPGGNDRELFAVLWPTTWRFGLQLLSNYFAIVGSIAVANKVFGGENAAAYVFSLNVIYTICQGMSAVWTSVKWPLISQLRAVNDSSGLRRILWSRIWLQVMTFCLLAGFVVTLGPFFLELWFPNKTLLPRHWLVLLAIHSLLENHFSVWTTLLSTENRIPSLWTTFATNLLGFGFMLLFLFYLKLGIGSFVLGPLVSGCLFIFWYWPAKGARSLGTSWFKFMATKPR